MNLFDLKMVEIFLLKLFGLEVIKRKLIIHKSGVPETPFFKGSLQHGMVAWHKQSRPHLERVNKISRLVISEVHSMRRVKK